jgi:hypothetical protein
MATKVKPKRKNPWAGLIKPARPHKGKMAASRILAVFAEDSGK